MVEILRYHWATGCLRDLEVARWRKSRRCWVVVFFSTIIGIKVWRTPPEKSNMTNGTTSMNESIYLLWKRVIFQTVANILLDLQSGVMNADFFWGKKYFIYIFCLAQWNNISPTWIFSEIARDFPKPHLPLGVKKRVFGRYNLSRLNASTWLQAHPS